MNAPALLRLDKGAALLEIEDHTGELHDYSVAPAACLPINGEVWACALTRLDGKGSSADTPHRIALSARGRWSCTCEDSRFRPQKRGRCIHANAAAPFYEQHQRLFPTEIEQMAKAPAEDAPPVAGVFRAIARVQGELSKIGIGKNRRNEAQKFSFRGIDDVMNGLSPLLAEVGLLILPVAITREAAERPSKSGGTLIHVTLHVAYDFVCVADGSRCNVVSQGEAMDSGDKATSKALSMAYKTLCFQAFCIPTEGTPDADAETHAVAGDRPAPPQEQPATPWWERLSATDHELALAGHCREGELVHAVAAMGKAHGYPADFSAWDRTQKLAASELVNAFKAERRATQKQTA